MKSVLVFLSFFFLSISNAQVSLSDSVCHSNVEKQATVMANLLLAKNYKEFISYTYAPILKMAGGLEKLTSYMEKSFNQMEEQGFSITAVIISNSSKMIHTKNQIQCTLVEEIELKNTDGKLIQKSTLIGISNDQGETWTFIDTHGKPLKDLQTTIKELSNDLVIPKQEAPTIISN